MIQLKSSTNLIVLLIWLAFLFQNIIYDSEIIFGLNINFIQSQFYFQPLTTIFIHGGFFHILMNTLVLYQFGNIIELQFGKKTLFILFFIGGVLTSLLSFLYIYELKLFSHNLVGASGAISVLFGYYAYFVKHERVAIVIWIVLISFAPLYFGVNVAWYAHLIGFAVGIVAALFADKVFH